MKNENEMNIVKIETYVSSINKSLISIKNANRKFFEILQDAYLELTTDEYDELVTRIDLSESTVRKMRAVFKNKTIRKNMKVLPLSWGTLYQLSLMEEKDLQQSIKNKVVTIKTTAKEAREVCEQYKELESNKDASNEDEFVPRTTYKFEIIVDESMTEEYVMKKVQRVLGQNCSINTLFDDEEMAEAA